MAKVAYITGNRNTVFVNSATPNAYTPIVNGGMRQITTESEAQITYRIAGTFSNLSVSIKTNTANASSTVKLRNNLGDGNLGVTIAAGATGYFSDTDSDSVVSGDAINYHANTAATSGQVIVESFRILFKASVNTSSVMGLLGGIGPNVTSTTYFWALAGGGQNAANSTNENVVKYKCGMDITFSNLFIKVITNGRSTNTIVYFR